MKRVLAFNYVLKGPDGNVLDASERGQPLPFLEGTGQIIPKLEEEIKDLKEGDKKIVKLPQGAHIVKVSKMSDTHVTLDGNHPLAGQDLEFDIEMVLIREATTDEVLHGHPHGLHGNAGHH